jgi:DNA repair exonuclease SbcCD ATPase subunit
MTDQTPGDVQATSPAPADSTPASAPVTPVQTPAAEYPPELADLIAEMLRDPVGMARHLKETRTEAAKRRHAEKAAEEAARRAEENRLAEQQKWQELADLRQKELDQYKPRAERVEALESVVRETIQARISALPEQWRDAVPEFEDPAKTLKWLDANASKFAVPRPPSTDAGVRSDVKPVAALSDEERQFAQAAGMTEDQYREYKAKTKVDAERRTQFPKILQA